MKRGHFFKEGVRNIKTTGTITRSSRFLSRRMIDSIDFDKARLIFEFGPGDGLITQHILDRMHPDARLLAFEIQDTFCEILEQRIVDPRFQLIKESAEHVSKYIDPASGKYADYIVSAIPFVVLPKELSIDIVQKSKDALRDDGQFIQMHYSLTLKSMYKRIFPNVKIDFELVNIPPAFVFRCSK